MDDRQEMKILKCLGEEPRDAGELARLLAISRDTLFSMLSEMEKDKLITWDGGKWSLVLIGDHDKDVK